MWKVSFKDPYSKKVQRFNDKVTVVTLTGFMKIPKDTLDYMPPSIYQWINSLHNPEIETCYTVSGLHIISKGIAKRADDDIDNPIGAERLAESRAKATIYWFVLKLADKYVRYYNKVVTGDEQIYIEESDKYSDNSLYAIMDRYNELYQRELDHMNHLLKTL